MKGLVYRLLPVFLAMFVASCAGDNPYPGDGGSLFQDPTKSDLQDAQKQLDPAKLATLHIGVSTKRQIVEMFGTPTWWESNSNGYSRLDFDFHQKGGTVNTPYLAPATFIFDSKNVLVDANYPGSYKTIHVERGPYKYAYFRGLVKSFGEDLDGEVPAESGEKPFWGSLIRVPVRAQDTVYGNIPSRDLALVFTIGDARIPPWPAYFLISIDRFGTIGVLTWDIRPSLCTIDDAQVQVPEIKPVVAAIKSSPTCAVATKSSVSR
jgi:hypothetical protein